MLLRVVQSTDVDAIEMMFNIRCSVKENYQSREEIAALGLTPETVANMLATDCRAWLAEQNGQSMGLAIANATQATILGMFVRPQFEKQGVGRSLMETAENWLWSQGLDEIWLLTGNDPTLRAYGFYQHLGWTLSEIITEGDFAGEAKFIKQRP